MHKTEQASLARPCQGDDGVTRVRFSGRSIEFYHEHQHDGGHCCHTGPAGIVEQIDCGLSCAVKFKLTTSQRVYTFTIQFFCTQVVPLNIANMALALDAYLANMRLTSSGILIDHDGPNEDVKPLVEGAKPLVDGDIHYGSSSGPVAFRLVVTQEVVRDTRLV